MTFWLIKSGMPDMWEYWAEDGVISVGWDVGPDVDAPWDEFRARVMDKFNSDSKRWGGNAVGAIKSLAGTHRDANKQMETGDTVIVVGTQSVYGHSVIRAVVEVGDYRFVGSGISPTGDHTYTREVEEWLYGDPDASSEDEGPVPKSRLPTEFHQEGNSTLHLASTLKRAPFHDQDTLDRLLQGLVEADPIKEPDYGLYVNSERAVEEYLKDNIEKLDSDIDPERVESQRQLTQESRVDLYCFYQDSGGAVIVELKQKEAGTNALDQLRRYLDFEQDEGTAVDGLLVAESFTPEVMQRVEGMDDVEAHQIEIDLEFTAVE